ncbi:MAG: PDZ domain-containing protein [Planctomycetota bacterium]
MVQRTLERGVTPAARMRVLLPLCLAAFLGAAHCQEPVPIDSQQVESEPSVETDQPSTSSSVGKLPGLPRRTLGEWASQLSSDSYLRRKAATRNLIRGGQKSIPILLEQLKSNDLEVVKRVVSILSRIAEKEDPTLSDKPGSAFDSLRQIADKGIGVKAYLADSIVDGFLEQRDLEARQRLSASGIFVGFEDQALGSSKKERAVVRIDEQWDGNLKVLPWLRWVRETNFAILIGPAARAEVVEWIMQIRGLDALVIKEAELSVETLNRIRDPHGVNAFELRYVRLDEKQLRAIEEAAIRNTLYLVGTGVQRDRVELMRTRLPGLDITLRQGGFLGVICYRPDAPYCQVNEVARDSGAEMAGLQPNDIIIGIDGVRISKFEDLQKQVDTHIPGDKIKLRYRRDNQVLEGTATLGKLQDQ